MNTTETPLCNDLILLVGNFLKYKDFTINNNNELTILNICQKCVEPKKHKGMRNRKYCKKCKPLKYHRPAPFTLGGRIVEVLENFNEPIEYKKLIKIMKPKYPNGKCIKDAFDTLIHFGHIYYEGSTVGITKNNTKHIYC